MSIGTFMDAKESHVKAAVSLSSGPYKTAGLHIFAEFASENRKVVEANLN